MRGGRNVCRLLARLFAVCAASLLALPGCIRDDLPPCPPLQVKIRVLDKNYFNIDAVSRLTGLDHRIDENGPFRSYVQKLFYVLYDLHTEEVVTIRHLHDVTGDAREATAYLPEDLPFGDYVLVVWGNIPSEEPILEDGNFMTYDMHTDAVEGFDPYVGCDTLHYTLEQHTDTVYIERVKGKLLIEATGLPQEVNRSKKHILGLYGRANVAEAAYEAPGASVFTDLQWEPQWSVSSDTYVSPTGYEQGSLVSVDFFDGPEAETPVFSPEDVEVDFRRNTITVLRYAYDEERGEFVIYVMIDDNWEVLHGMELD